MPLRLYVKTSSLLAAIILSILTNAPGKAQSSAATPQWQLAAGGKMAFDVASVKLSRGEFTSPNFPLGNGDAFVKVSTGEAPGGRFKADFPLWTFIGFAYKLSLTEDQSRKILADLPKWVTADRYTIEARASGNPTKDQMRLMMQSLLADRFGLSLHFETQEVSALALTFLKAGKMGPSLILHADGPSCDAVAEPTADGSLPKVFPPKCGVYDREETSHGTFLAARDSTMELLAATIAGLPDVGRTVVDKTGLSEKIDFRIQWTPERVGSAAAGAEVPPPDPQAPTFLQALRDQLGLRLEATKALLQLPVIDHVERPSEN